ncbi:hypothetical protein HYT91_03700 [Candidatus Pacearchaeota archaeon]|nr:hypothetical protein [Candidatus Pacearchaeota archaeon]
MENKNKNFILLALLIGIIFLFNAGIASAEQNLTIEEQAEKCLVDSKETLNGLLNDGFNVERVNDSLETAINLYEGQSALKQKKGNYDFSLVLVYCNDIKNIKEIAYIARDEFDVLSKFYEGAFNFDKEIDLQNIEGMFNEIENEIKSERYEKVHPLVEQTYQEITDAQARQTTLNVFYENTARGLKRFFEKNWIFLSSFIALIIILFFVYHKVLSKWIIKRKIQNLELRKETLSKIIQETQRDYFQYGKISEGIFNVKTKKLAELIRDIDREIPLLYEELTKFGKKSKEFLEYPISKSEIQNKNEQKTGNFLTNSPKRGRVKELAKSEKGGKEFSALHFSKAEAESQKEQKTPAERRFIIKKPRFLAFLTNLLQGKLNIKRSKKHKRKK